MTLAFPAPEPARRVTLALPHPAASRSAPMAPAAAGQPALCHDARRLTGGQGTATIVLDGQAYVLRITRAGKLILTK